MTDTVTDDLRERIHDAETRNAERAAQLVPANSNGDAVDADAAASNGLVDKAAQHLADATNKAATFAREHPVLAISGGLVAGLAIASMFKGPRKLASKGGVKAAGLATVGAEMALAYALDAYEKALEASREGARKLDDMGDTVSDTARKVRRDAGYRVDEVGDAARIKARDAKKAITRKFGRS